MADSLALIETISKSVAEHKVRSLIPQLPAKPTFGRVEANAVAAAVATARDEGAEKVVVVAWSAGTLAAARALTMDVSIDGLVLVAPIFGPRQFVRDLAKSRHLPRLTADIAIALARSPFASLLGGERLDMSDGSQVLAQKPSVTIHSSGDATSRLIRSENFSNATPLNTLVRTRSAPHTLEWNTDRLEWERGVGAFLHAHGFCSIDHDE